MGFGSSRFVRVVAVPAQEIELPTNPETNDVQVTKPGWKKGITFKKTISFKAKVLSRVFPEDYDNAKNKILDPKGEAIQNWNKAFLAACVVSIFVDPLFYYLPIVSQNVCIDISGTFRIILTIIRSIADVFYAIQIIVKFHTAYVAPSTRVVGRGELVIDSTKIAFRYLRHGFLLDLVAAIPIPQVLVWLIVPNIDGWAVMHIQNAVWFLIMLQYLPRIGLLFPLWSKVADSAGVVTRTAWAGAAYNLLLYMFAAHVSGAVYYLLYLERLEDCWHNVCSLEKPNCPDMFFDCRNINDPNRVDWFQSSNVTNQCNGFVNIPILGIYGPAMQFGTGSVAFMNKYFYCLWWGLKNLSTEGQNLITSIYVGENIFVFIVATLGLVCLALFIGNVQRYVHSATKRLEEWKIMRADTEQWMHQRHIPAQLRQHVRKYDYYKWLTTKGVDEEALINGLPWDLRRKVKQHLCLDLIRQVPLFDQMDETMLDAICLRLKPASCIKDECLIREGDPVNQMLFIFRGHFESFINDGSFNSYAIGPGDFCGEELLTWAVDPLPDVVLPKSTRSIKAVNEVEAFALVAQDLKFVAWQFRRLNGKQFRHKLRFYSQQWRTWAARTIQLQWRRYKKWKDEGRPIEPGTPRPGSFWSLFAERLVASARWNTKQNKQSEFDSGRKSEIEKPEEPDFLDDEKWMADDTIDLASNISRNYD